jgi:hypothetical protein
MKNVAKPLSILLLSTLPLILLSLLGEVARVEALSCMPCYDKQGNYQGPKCEALPEDDSCEQAFRPCGCCPECAGSEGDECHGMSVKCKTGLSCVNPKTGEAKEEVAWYMHEFRGTCQRV